MTENTSATEPVAKELTMTDKPEQWAVELLDAVFDASDLGSACGIVDCPQCANAALTIQRAFEERERKLRGQLTFIQQSHDWMYGEKQRLENALKDIASRAHAHLATRQDAPVTENRHEL